MEAINPLPIQDPLTRDAPPDGLGRHRPGRGALWAKVQGMEATLRFLESHPQVTAGRRLQLGQLIERLAQARKCIAGRRFFQSNDDMCLGLVHELEADLLLIMPLDMLGMEAQRVEEQFRRNIDDPIARATWLGSRKRPGPLRVTAQWMIQKAGRVEGLGTEETAQLLSARHVLRNALRMVNEHADLHTRQLSFALQIRIWSCVLLVLMFLGSLLLQEGLWLRNGGEARAELLSLVILGAAGAIVANMLSETPVLVSSGPLWRHVAYYLLVRPSLGAFAAFLFYLLARSQLLFGFEVGNGDVQQGQPPIRIALGGAQAIDYAYALISIAVGFSAEKLLGATMDGVLGRLFSVAEQSVTSTRVPSAGGTGPRVSDDS